MYRCGIALAPILRGKDEHRALNSRVQHLKQSLYLISHIKSGYRRISERADHNAVREIYAKGNEILKCYGD
jgi:hypothetical protein